MWCSLVEVRWSNGGNRSGLRGIHATRTAYRELLAALLPSLHAFQDLGFDEVSLYPDLDGSPFERSRRGRSGSVSNMKAVGKGCERLQKILVRRLFEFLVKRASAYRSTA
jgi:hypothetical protein